MAGPELPFERAVEGERPPARQPPGEFVTPELQSQCARFLEDVKIMVDRRKNQPARALPPRQDPGA